MSRCKNPERGMLAESEDEPRVWYRRDVTPSPALARWRVMAHWDLTGCPWWKLTVKASHMCPHDCAIDHDAADQAEISENDGRCRYVDDGWMHECKAGHPGAIAVWRVEDRVPPMWWQKLRRRLRHMHPAFGSVRPPVLWGGRIERKPRWFDKLLLGRSCFLIPGGTWHRLGQGEIAWCDTCGRRTLHQHLGAHPLDGANTRRMCLAERHYEYAVAEGRPARLRLAPDSSPTERQEAP